MLTTLERNEVVLHGNTTYSKFISEEKIKERIKELSEELFINFKDKNPLFLPVLNGSFIFSADLVRQLDFPCDIAFVKVASYEGIGTIEIIKFLTGLTEEITGRNIVILEDIVNTGNTLTQLISQLKLKCPLSITTVCLLHKKGNQKYDIQPDYVGFIVKNYFYIGYGLDCDGFGRNLPSIYKLEN